MFEDKVSESVSQWFQHLIQARGRARSPRRGRSGAKAVSVGGAPRRNRREGLHREMNDTL